MDLASIALTEVCIEAPSTEWWSPSIGEANINAKAGCATCFKVQFNFLTIPVFDSVFIVGDNFSIILSKHEDSTGWFSIDWIGVGVDCDEQKAQNDD